MSRNNQKRVDASHINRKLKPILNIQPQIYIPVIYSTVLIFIALIIFLGVLYNPKKAVVKPIPLTLTTSSMDKQMILERGFEEASLWSIIDEKEIKKRYRIPPILSSTVKDYYSTSPINKDEIKRFLTSSIKLVTNQLILSDYLRALVISKSEGKMLSSSSIKNSAIFIDNLIKKMPDLPLLIESKIITAKSVDLNIDYFKDLKERSNKVVNTNAISFSKDKKDIMVDDFLFNYIPKSEIQPRDVNFLHNVSQDGFYILDKMVSRNNFSRFIKENPYWDTENKEILIEAGLVDRYYLDFDLENEYVTNVSFYATQAWLKWAMNNYNIPEGWSLELPTENMWHAATIYKNMEQNSAWLWTNQGFYLYDHYLSDKNGKLPKEFTDITPKTVVGRNRYINKKETGRGVQDATWCTPYLGIRPVLVRKK